MGNFIEAGEAVRLASEAEKVGGKFLLTQIERCFANEDVCVTAT
jgi:hypothetical protein